MLTTTTKGTLGEFTLNLPTSLNEIDESYIANVTSHVKVAPDYSLIGLVYRERISSLLLAARKNSKKTDISVIPIFVKAGKTDSEFINNLNCRDKLIVAPSDIMMGYHVSAPGNNLTINTVINIVEDDANCYQMLLTKKDECYFIEFKLVPNCTIHGAYGKANIAELKDNFIIKTASYNSSKDSGIII